MNIVAGLFWQALCWLALQSATSSLTAVSPTYTWPKVIIQKKEKKKVQWFTSKHCSKVLWSTRVTMKLYLFTLKKRPSCVVYGFGDMRYTGSCSFSHSPWGCLAAKGIFSFFSGMDTITGAHQFLKRVCSHMWLNFMAWCALTCVRQLRPQ